MPIIGPEFATRKPRFNHVAMSLTPEMLDEEHRKLRADFFGDVFGFVDIPMMTIDRKRQVFQVHNIEQFVFLIADDGGSAMECPRLHDHGMLAITSIYVRYLLPMMCEIQWWDYHEPRPGSEAKEIV